jgi:hypothetical protein
VTAPTQTPGTVSLTLRRGARDLALPCAIATALIAAITLVSLVAPAGVRAPATAAAGAVVVLVAFMRWPKAALVVFALFMLVYDSFAHWLNPGVHQVDELVIPGLVLIAAWRLRPWRRGVFEALRDGALVVVLLLAVLSSLVNAVPAGTWLVGLLLLVKSVAFLHVVLWHDWSIDDVRRAVTSVFFFALVVLGVGLAEALIGPRLRDVIGLPVLADVRGQLPGISSIMLFVVLFSWFNAFVALFLFAYYLVFRRLWLLVAALAFGAGTFLSGRRRALVGLATALVSGALAQARLGVSRRTLARVWLPIGGVALVLVIVFLPGLTDLARQTLIEYGGPLPVLVEPGQPETPGQIDYVNGNPRLLLYVTSVEVARDYFPLGAGLGRYGSPMSRIDFSPLYAHYGLDRIWGLTPEYDAYITDTFWPHVLGEMGVFGLIGYLAFIGALGLGLWRATRSLVDPFAHAFALGALMAFVHAAVESLASSMYESPPRIYLAFGAVAVALALARATRARAAQAPGLAET